MSLLRDAWEQREHVIYQSIFHILGKDIHPLDINVFQRGFGIDDIDPRWMFSGVFKCPPTNRRRNWVYVTSGMSNPWETHKTKVESGIGCEFILETTAECDWAIDALKNLMALNILLSNGYYGDKPKIAVGERVPLAMNQRTTNVMIVEPKDYPSSFDLVSGRVKLLQVIGVTTSDIEFAQKNGTNELVSTLTARHDTFALDLPHQRRLN
ncbi:suppressor of fused domain protein [Marinibactrum halimedae]|uniref:Suppressor of fused-like domain-containing protein n=1 Tax=Marinibactrum halimedae TaxID=1444977 RepID=A0AA37T2N3_9GAMM|nr:suppressor of fused domain protein [Marinibactrum halimedae]MCD9458799.1 suppressor of fused domain protein [Marinibactrum halimedae]GLS25358.1 hypothetical protein GCM10007877_10720 [Marinibactrum halimedae]